MKTIGGSLLKAIGGISLVHWWTLMKTIGGSLQKAIGGY